jgi:hypothetical protein
VADELLDEERVAARLRADDADGGGLDVTAVRGLDQLGHFALVHAVEPDPGDRTVALDVGDEVRQRMPRLSSVSRNVPTMSTRPSCGCGRGAGRAAATSGRPSAGRR